MPMQFVIQQSQLKLKVSECTFQNNYSKPTNYIYNPTQNPSMKKFMLISLGLLTLFTELKAQDSKSFQGYFNYTYSHKDGKISLEVKELDKEFLYVTSLSSGVGSNDIGLDRGQLGRERIVKCPIRSLGFYHRQRRKRNIDHRLDSASNVRCARCKWPFRIHPARLLSARSIPECHRHGAH